MAESQIIEIECSVCHGRQKFRVNDAATGRSKALDYLERETDWNVVNGEPICPDHLPNRLRRGLAYGLLFIIPFWATVIFAVFIIWGLIRG